MQTGWPIPRSPATSPGRRTRTWPLRAASRRGGGRVRPGRRLSLGDHAARGRRSGGRHQRGLARQAHGERTARLVPFAQALGKGTDDGGGRARRRLSLFRSRPLPHCGKTRRAERRIGQGDGKVRHAGGRGAARRLAHALYGGACRRLRARDPARGMGAAAHRRGAFRIDARGKTVYIFSEIQYNGRERKTAGESK